MKNPGQPSKYAPCTVRRGRSGFTLVEVVLALMIFAMLGGAVFVSVRAVTGASILLGGEQMKIRKEDAFLAWLRRGFRNLSAESEVVLRTRKGGDAGLAVELIVRRSPGAFSLGAFDARGGDVVLAAIPDGRGGASFSIARFPGRLSLEESVDFLSEAEWLPILENIRTLRWTFWSLSEGRYVEEWTEGQDIPELIRLEMTLTGGEIIEATFRVPKLERSSNLPDPDETPEPSPEP